MGRTQKLYRQDEEMINFTLRLGNFMPVANYYKDFNKRLTKSDLTASLEFFPVSSIINIALHISMTKFYINFGILGVGFSLTLSKRWTYEDL